MRLLRHLQHWHSGSDPRLHVGVIAPFPTQTGQLRVYPLKSNTC
jgi:hypothetical protein